MSEPKFAVTLYAESLEELGVILRKLDSPTVATVPATAPSVPVATESVTAKVPVAPPEVATPVAAPGASAEEMDDFLMEGPEEDEPTLDKLKEVLNNAAKSGKRREALALLTTAGFNRIADVTPDKLADLYSKAKAL